MSCSPPPRARTLTLRAGTSAPPASTMITDTSLNASKLLYWRACASFGFAVGLMTNSASVTSSVLKMSPAVLKSLT